MQIEVNRRGEKSKLATDVKAPRQALRLKVCRPETSSPAGHVLGYAGRRSRSLFEVQDHRPSYLTFANPKRTETRGAGNWYQRPMGFSVSIGNRGIRGLRFRKTYSSTSTSHRDCGAQKGPCINHKILADHNPAQSTWFWLRRRKHRKQKPEVLLTKHQHKEEITATQTHTACYSRFQSQTGYNPTPRRASHSQSMEHPAPNRR